MQMIYEGKAKQVCTSDIPEQVIIKFKDDATAFNGLKKDSFQGKGEINLAFSEYFFNILTDNDINTHYISGLTNKSFKAQKVNIIPLEVVVRNYAAGSICKRENYKKGHKFEQPLVEFFEKDDSKGDPIISEEEIVNNNIATAAEVSQIKKEALKINDILFKHLDLRGIMLVDFKLEFGKDANNKILLADEISPDTCRFWEKNTLKSLDKDVYREETGDLVLTYKTIAEILGVKYEI